MIQYTGPLAYRTSDGELVIASSEEAKQAALENDSQAMTDPNELVFGADIMVMANPYMSDVPPWAIALLMAGCIAAALSTAAGLLLVLSTSISHDLLKKILKPELTDKEEVSWARIASFVSLAVAAYFGINPPSAFIAKTVAFAFGLAASSFFPTLLIGIFSKRMSREGAIAGMISGISFTLGYIIYFQFLGGDSADYLLGISPEGIGTLGMLINFTVSFTVNIFSPAPPLEVQQMVEEIHIPSGAGGSVDH
jgi:cation/acetate symporter